MKDGSVVADVILTPYIVGITYVAGITGNLGPGPSSRLRPAAFRVILSPDMPEQVVVGHGQQ